MNPFATELAGWYNDWMYILHAYPFVGWILVLCIGLVSGSFLGCLIYRLPRKLMDEWKCQAAMLLAQSQPKHAAPHTPAPGLWYPPSHCTSCGVQVRWYDLIPLLGYALLRGKCRACHTPIALFYPAIELLCGLYALWVFWLFTPGLLAFAVWVFGLIGLALAYIDGKNTILPDQLVLPLLWLGLIVNYFALLVPFTSSFWGVIGVYLAFAAIATLSEKILGREALGWGDVKLCAALAAWLGWEVMPIVVLLATTSALMYLLLRALQSGTSVRYPMPFGPFLIAAGWVVLQTVQIFGFSGTLNLLP